MINPHQLYSQLLRQLYRRPAMAFAVHCAHVALLAIFLWRELPLTIFFIWLGIAQAGGLWQWFAGHRALKHLVEDSLKGGSITPYVIAAGAGGLGIGITALLFPYLSLTTRLFVILMLGAVAAGGLARLSALPFVYAAFLSGVVTPLVPVLILVDGEPGWSAIPVVLLVAASLLYSARQLHTDLLDGLLSRFGLENAAGEDKLTHLANRRRFDIVLEQEWRRARNHSGVPISLIMVDVDFFKKFNDRYGHQEGDYCLAQVALTLSKSARRSIDLVARYGGEEFVILLIQTTRDDAYELCERMRSSVENLNIPHQDSPLGRVTISLGGITLYARENLNAVELVRTADKALYRAKATGRNKVVWYDPSLDENTEQSDCSASA